MSAETISGIKVDPVISRLVQPPSEKELEDTYDEYTAASALPIIHTWQGKHLNDQYLYQLCSEYDFPYDISELFFEDLKQAALYVCSRQLSRKTLTPEYRKYIIGQQFNYLTMDADDTKQSDSKYTIASSLGHELYMSAGTVIKYSFFSTALNTIFEQSVELAQRILLGKVRISHENILELARLMPEEIRSVAGAVISENIGHISLSYIRNEAQWSHIQTCKAQSRREQREQKMAKHAAIREMPKYDPDSEVNSLCMTIDSWNSSFQRVYNSDNFKKITKNARLQLMKKLSLLEHTINIIQESLVERNAV